MALAVLAVNRDYKVLYREAHQLVEDLNEERELGALHRLRLQIRTTALLIDDPFLCRLPAHAGNELADVLTILYEKGATFITSNRQFEDWPTFLDDVV